MKNDNIVNVLKVFLCCVGTVIGAGFASGQEIMTFFVRYGKISAVSMAMCGALFFAYIYVVLKKVSTCNVETFEDYFKDIAGAKTSSALQWISYAFMFASFCVMVSGSGAVAEQMFGAQTLGVLFMASLCFFVFLKGTDGMVIVNAFMTPVIIVGIVLIGVLTFFTAEDVFAPVFNVKNNFLTSGLLYLSYNTITLIGVLLPLRDNVKNKKTAFCSALLSGGTLFLMGAVLLCALFMFENELEGVSVPVLYIAEKINKVSGYVYALVLYMAMITTAVSSGYAFLSFLKKYVRINYMVLAFMLCAVSVPMAYVGFADLVDKLYTFFGFLGMFLLFSVFFDGFRRIKKKKL